MYLNNVSICAQKVVALSAEVSALRKKGTKLHFKSPTAERRHVLCVGVGGDRTHASRPEEQGMCTFRQLG